MTADPFAEEIARLEAELEKVRDARAVYLRLVAGRDAPPPPAAPAPRPAAQEPPPGKQPPPPDAPAGAGKSSAVNLARTLAGRGPLRLGELADAVGSDAGSVARQLKKRTDLFRKQDGNQTAPWELTPEGRRVGAGTA